MKRREPLESPFGLDRGPHRAVPPGSRAQLFMPESTSFLHAYLRTVLALHRLESVTVFLPQDPQRPLVHVGDGLAPPEMSTVPLALDYAERHEAESQGQIVTSHEQDCRLVLLRRGGADSSALGRRFATDSAVSLSESFAAAAAVDR